MVKENNYTQHAMLQHEYLHYKKHLLSKSPEINPISRKYFTINFPDRKYNI